MVRPVCSEHPMRFDDLSLLQIYLPSSLLVIVISESSFALKVYPKSTPEVDFVMIDISLFSE